MDGLPPALPNLGAGGSEGCFLPPMFSPQIFPLQGQHLNTVVFRGPGVPQSRVPMPDLPLAQCMALSLSLNHLLPQFPHL